MPAPGVLQAQGRLLSILTENSWGRGTEMWAVRDGKN